MTTRGSSPRADRDQDVVTVMELGERALITRIRSRLPPPPASLVVGIGDDAAVAEVDRGALAVLTTDALVEGIHFDRRFSSPADIGYKALAVNVSDIAAMGAAPRFALLSLILPEQLTVAEVDGIIDGVIEIAAATGVTLAGGNITRSPGPLIVDVALTGAVKPRRTLTRSGGRAGDHLYVTGTIGGAAAGLAWLRAHADARKGRADDHATGSEPEEPDETMNACVARHRRPQPRARAGALLGRTRAASACMDLSDGLADAVRQIAQSSGTGAIVDAALLPIDPGAERWFRARGQDPVTASAGGGDDYELLFAVPRRTASRLRLVRSQSRGVGMTRIGELTADPALVVKRGSSNEPLPDGFVHF